jgi:uncharacterized protein (TIGR03382 family)
MPSSLRAGFTALLLLSTAARAQTITLSFTGSTNDTANKGPGTCNDQVLVVWTASGLTTANTCGSLQVWVANGAACGTSPGTSASDGGTDLIIDTASLSTTTTGTPQFVVSAMPGLAGQDCNSAIDVTNAVCAAVQSKAVDGTCSGTVQGTPLLSVRYDSVPPDPPSVGLTAQDAKILVGLSANGSQASDVLSYIVEYAIQPSDQSAPVFKQAGGEVAAASGRLTIDGLLNGTTYLVRGFALDEVSNKSQASSVQSAMPLASDGFFARYEEAGGKEQGGCSAVGAGLPSIIGALAVLAAVLRRRR